MIRGSVVFSNPASLWLARFTFWLVVVLLCGIALTGCGSTAGVFGLASKDRLEERVEDLTDYADNAAKARQDQTHAAIAAAFEPLDPLAPGLANYVRASLDDAKYLPPKPVPPTPEDPALPPWAATLGEIGAAVALSYLGVNAARNRARKARGEALTPEEAKAKGYFEEGKAV